MSNNIRSTIAEELAELETRFSYHPPRNDEEKNFYETFRDDVKRLGVVILEECRPSRERSIALTALDQVVMWANASVARRGLRERHY